MKTLSVELKCKYRKLKNRFLYSSLLTSILTILSYVSLLVFSNYITLFLLVLFLAVSIILFVLSTVYGDRLCENIYKIKKIRKHHRKNLELKNTIEDIFLKNNHK